MTKEQQTICIAGLISGGLFLLVVTVGLGPLFMFISTLPLFSAGLARHPNITLKAAGLGALIVTFSGDITSTILYFFIFALPSWYICHCALMSRDLQLGDAANTRIRLWFPIGLATAHLAVYFCGLLALITALFASGDTTLPAMLAHNFDEQIKLIEKTYAISMEVSATQLAFMACGVSGWLWGMGLWVHGWLANRALAKRNLALRPNFMITPFPMPHWLLTFMGICALASLIGGESLAFLGRASLIVLLMPYFFLGAAFLHIGTLSWPNRRFFLFFIYFCIFTQFWPALLLSGMGLWHHIKTLNKHLSVSGTSFKG